MSWLLFYLLAALHPVLFLVIALRCETWRRRLLYWAILPLPAIAYCWDYWVIKNEHMQMCASEGGLKVLIQPESADGVRLLGDIGEWLGKNLFQSYYPKLRVVESVTEDRDPKTGERLKHLDRHTATPNPREGMPMGKYPWKEPPYIVATARLEAPEAAVFEVSQQKIRVGHGMKTVLTLSKDRRVYATHTEIVHVWGGIRYPDAVPTWRCPNPFPPNDLHRPAVTWVPPQSGYSLILGLLFK